MSQSRRAARLIFISIQIVGELKLKASSLYAPRPETQSIISLPGGLWLPGSLQEDTV